LFKGLHLYCIHGTRSLDSAEDTTCQKCRNVQCSYSVHTESSSAVLRTV